MPWRVEHAAQEQAWFDAQPWERTPAALRKRLTGGEVLAHRSAHARFVGVEAYEAAGGVVRRDLFDNDDDCWFCDPELLRRLVADKLDRVAEQVRGEGWAWVEVRVQPEAGELRAFTRCDPVLRTATAEEKHDLAELDLRAAELEAEQGALDKAESWTPVDGERIELEEQDIEARRRAIDLARHVWRDADKASAGAIVMVGRDGEAEVVRGLLKASDRPVGKAAAASRPTREEGGGVMASLRAEDDVPEARAGYSEPLRQRLAAHRTAALQAVLAGQTHHALVALTPRAGAAGLRAGGLPRAFGIPVQRAPAPGTSCCARPTTW